MSIWHQISATPIGPSQYMPLVLWPGGGGGGSGMLTNDGQVYPKPELEVVE